MEDFVGTRQRHGHPGLIALLIFSHLGFCSEGTVQDGQGGSNLLGSFGEWNKNYKLGSRLELVS